jgi:hypothetical protein
MASSEEGEGVKIKMWQFSFMDRKVTGRLNSGVLLLYDP